MAMNDKSRSFFHRAQRWLALKVRRWVSQPILNVGELILGKDVIIEPGVEIHCRRLVLGDGVIIREGTRIEMRDLVVGDYTRIYNHALFTGDAPCRIGHNCWIGHFTIINATDEFRMGNGVGVGAHSQLWTHNYFGDVLDGCRFASQKPMLIEDDVWFTGHSIVTPITARRRSMALVGSVVTKDMEENHVYAGAPAKDVTEKLGTQFQSRSLEEKQVIMQGYLDEFLLNRKLAQNRIRIVDKIDLAQKELSQFSLTERVYLKHLYEEEMLFMKFLTPTKAKFNPHPTTDWMTPFFTI
jgi:acetyltransferase-like isoleucine patch superfamily enzyme